MANYTAKITERVFDAVKLLLESGSSKTEIGKYMKLSFMSVSLIEQAETFDEYKAISYEFYKSKKKKMAAVKAKEKAEEPAPEKQEQPATQVVEHRQSVTIQATHFMDTKLDKIIELLTIMNNKLGAIIDDLYGTSKGGGQK